MCRTQFHLSKPNGEGHISFFIDLPARVQMDDLVSADELLPEELAADDGNAWIYEVGLFDVYCTSWGKDELGIYLSVTLCQDKS